MENKQTLNDDPIHIFRLQNRFSLYYYAGFWSFITLLTFILFIDDILVDIIPRSSMDLPWYGVIIFLIGIIGTIFMAWKNYYRAKNECLCIYSWGLRYDEFDFSVTTTWDNIKSIDPSPGQSLALKESVKINIRFPIGSPPPESLSKRDFIPLWPFRIPEIGNELESTLRKYLPHLFDGLPEKKSEDREY